jgi:hypothetical protein
VKYLRGDKLFFESILPRLRTRRILPGLKIGPILLVCFVRFYQSDFTRAENWAEGVSDFEVWDIGQVTVSNFDWLPFNPPPLVTFSGPSIGIRAGLVTSWL